MYIIYKITNLLNNKIYIGQTTETLDKRFKRHCGYQLNDGTYLHNAMKKYGVENFSIEQIDEAENQDALDEFELYWIEYYKSYDLNVGYNIRKTKGKCGGDTLSNNPNLPEISQKLSQTKLGGKNPNATKVIAIDTTNDEQILFDSFSDCQKYLDIPRHDIISRRCRGKINKPYCGKWMFKYVN